MCPTLPHTHQWDWRYEGNILYGSFIKLNLGWCRLNMSYSSGRTSQTAGVKWTFWRKEAIAAIIIYNIDGPFTNIMQLICYSIDFTLQAKTLPAVKQFSPVRPQKMSTWHTELLCFSHYIVMTNKWFWTLFSHYQLSVIIIWFLLNWNTPRSKLQRYHW